MGDASDPPNGHASLAVTVIGEDIRHVNLRATTALAIAAVFVTQIDLDAIRGLPHSYRVLIVVGMGVLFISSVAYFVYSQQLNRARIKVATAGTLNIQDWPQSEEKQFRKGGLWLYYVGQACFVVGVVCLGIVIGRLFLGSHPPGVAVPRRAHASARVGSIPLDLETAPETSKTLKASASGGIRIFSREGLELMGTRE